MSDSAQNQSQNQPLTQDQTQTQPQTQPLVQSQDQPQPQGDTLASAVLQSAATTDPLNPLGVVSGKAVGAKERTAAVGLDALAKEVPGVQSVEAERRAEIPPELESWMEKVESREVAPPKQVVVADKTAMAPTGNYAAQPVVVLPLTQQGMKKGMKQSITDSIRWLTEWCFRIIKKLHGSVVYRQI